MMLSAKGLYNNLTASPTGSQETSYVFSISSRIVVLHFSCRASHYMGTLDELRAVFIMRNISALFSDLICLLGVSQSLQEQGRCMLGVAIMGFAVLAECQHDGPNGNIIHLHGQMGSFLLVEEPFFRG